MRDFLSTSSTGVLEMLSNLPPSRQKLVIRGSVILNLFLLLYLSLYAGWTTSASPEKPFNREILNSYFEASPPPQPAQAPEEEKKSGGPLSISPNTFCFNSNPQFSQGLRGSYWVLYNYIRGEKKFQCNESVTYTTHGDFTFLDNLEPLLKRWEGPISIAVYAPGSDLEDAIDSILYHRDCTNSTLVRDLATFHVFFDFAHTPAQVPRWKSLLNKRPNCLKPEGIAKPSESYRKRNKLDYPVNVARNVARQTVSTHYVFPSDIELYPSPNLIPTFLEMIRQNGPQLQKNNPRVFVNSIFEIEANHTLPETKTELIELIKKKIVIPFHKQVCSQCHKIPHSKEWLESKPSEGMNILYTGKRIKPYQHWEPIYIGTNEEPLYDERLSWEGRSDKMVQGFKLCALNYDFHILDNAFLIHRPGIKTKKTLHSALDTKKISAQNTLIKNKIFPQIKKLYGARKGCEMF